VAPNLEWVTLRSTFSQTVGVAVNKKQFRIATILVRTQPLDLHHDFSFYDVSKCVTKVCH
jgi:hypothetical protein